MTLEGMKVESAVVSHLRGGDVVGGCGGGEGCGGEGEDVCGEGFGGMHVEWVGLYSWDWCTL